MSYEQPPIALDTNDEEEQKILKERERLEKLFKEDVARLQPLESMIAAIRDKAKED